MFEGAVEISDVLQLTVLSMTVVFASLFAISLILELFKIVFYDRDNKKKEKNKVESLNKATESLNKTTESVVDLEDKQVLAALFTAAIAASNGKHASNLRIKSIKKVSNTE